LRAIGAAAVALTSAVALAAVALVPAVLLARESSRAGGIPAELASTWSMHPLRIIEWIWPNVFGDANQLTEHLARVAANSAGNVELSPYWALSLYISLPVLLLAAVGWARAHREIRQLGIAAVGFVMLALGRYTPIYGLYRAVFLPERVLRYPEKYIGGAILIACVVAGLGWTSLMRAPLGRRGRIAASAATGIFALAVLCCALFASRIVGSFTDASSGLTPPINADRAVHDVLRHGFAAIACLFVLGGALYLARRSTLRRAMHVVAILTCVAPLIALEWQVLPVFDRAITERPPAIVKDAVDGREHRIYRTTDWFVNDTETVEERALGFYDAAAPNTAVPFGFDYIPGYDQGHTAAFETTWKQLAPAGDRALDRLGVELKVLPSGDESLFRLVRNEGQRPRAFVTANWRWYRDGQSVTAAMLRDPIATTHLLGVGTDGDGNTTMSPCSIETTRPEDVVVTCDSQGGYAVLLDSWADGWTATVDGAPAPIEKADALVRAVAIAPGTHRIHYTFRTPGLRLGALISALAWLALGTFWIVARRKALRATAASQDE
jgi:hypothetical protein